SDSSRRWKREQDKNHGQTFTFVNPGISGLAVLGARLGNLGAFGGGGGGFKNGSPQDPYTMTLPTWAQEPPTSLPNSKKLSQNLYAPEPAVPMSRAHTPSALYATATLVPEPPVYMAPLPRARGTKSLASGGTKTPVAFGDSSEDDLDHGDCDLMMSRHQLRPKSRASYGAAAALAAVQSGGIYYEADYAQSDIYGRNPTSLLPQQPPIPMATYTVLDAGKMSTRPPCSCTHTPAHARTRVDPDYFLDDDDFKFG
ncbi:unnamed protein product, partial [Darwinula stevensoni]